MRALLSVAMAAAVVGAVCAPPTAADPADGIVLRYGGAEAVTSYTVDAGATELRVALGGPDGIPLLGRVRLIEGQRHTLVLEAGGDGGRDLQFSFVRVGGMIEVTGRLGDARAELLARF